MQRVIPTCWGVQGGLWQEVTAKRPPEGGGGSLTGRRRRALAGLGCILQEPVSLGALRPAASESDSAFCSERRGAGSASATSKALQQAGDACWGFFLERQATRILLWQPYSESCVWL